jgi:predicted RNA binding protein YcfA (HicA-like mRNA interferase family)
MKFKELLKIVKDDGWYEVRISGSHRQFHHPTKKGTVTIAGKPNKYVPKGTLNNILKQAYLK